MFEPIAASGLRTPSAAYKPFRKAPLKPKHIMMKTGAKSLSELVRLAVAANWESPAVA